MTAAWKSSSSIVIDHLISLCALPLHGRCIPAEKVCTLYPFLMLRATKRSASGECQEPKTFTKQVHLAQTQLSLTMHNSGVHTSKHLFIPSLSFFERTARPFLFSNETNKRPSSTAMQRHYSYIINHKKDHQTSQVSHSGSSNWPKASSPAGGPMDSDSSPSPALAGPHTGVPFS
jgi:hypothetical protein